MRDAASINTTPQQKVRRLRPRDYLISNQKATEPSSAICPSVPCVRRGEDWAFSSYSCSNSTIQHPCRWSALAPPSREALRRSGKKSEHHHPPLILVEAATSRDYYLSPPLPPSQLHTPPPAPFSNTLCCTPSRCFCRFDSAARVCIARELLLTAVQTKSRAPAGRLASIRCILGMLHLA